MPELTKPIDAQDHSLGPQNAPVTLVEYGDFQCPNCLEAVPVVDQILETVGDQLLYVWRQFPLTTTHPMAFRAAEASEAAAAQGKFWEMHDLIFEHQEELSEETLLRLAKELGLDMQQFRQDMQSRRFQPDVEEDFSTGVRSGVNGTPTFFVNGERYDGAWLDGSLLETLRQTIAAS
jgi:protein-disulfide isomerase